MPRQTSKSTKLWIGGIIVILSSGTILVCGVVVLVFGCIFCANISGMVSIAFPPPEKVAEQYFEAVLAGNMNAIQELTAEEGDPCRDSALLMAGYHIGRFRDSEVKDVNITAGYWPDAPTDYSPARKQIATITFKFRKPGESEWKSEKIRFNIWQSGWRYLVCGPPV
jgi:hypothetical protein